MVWEKLSTHCSKNGKAFTIEELAFHIKMIVSKQMSVSIPTNPLVFLPAQKALPQLGTQSPDIVAMDAARLETSDKFEQQARCTILKRKAVGISDRYSNIRPNSAPTIDKGLIDKRLDICLQYFIDAGRNDLRWTRGEVIFASDKTNIPRKQGRQACYKSGEAVVICWEKNTERK